MIEFVSYAAHAIGLIGMLFVVFAFNKVVSGKWDGQGVEFNVVNLIGAVLLLISLIVHFNLGSVIIEIFWIAIALKGLRKADLTSVNWRSFIRGCLKR